MSQTKAIVEIIEIPLDRIRPSPYQPRLSFNLEDIRGSIQRDGILVPLTVRKKDGYYELIDGERRVRLAKELGYKTIACTLIDVDDETARRMVWKINTLRQEYTPKEKAYHFKKLQEEYGMSLRGIARECDYHPNAVLAHLNVFKLPEKYQNLIWDRGSPLTVGHVQELEPFFSSSVPISTITDRLDLIIERKLTVHEFRDVLKPDLEAIREKRIKAAKEVVEEITPAPEVKLETPEDLEEAAKILRRRAEELKTPEQKHQELVDKARKALNSFPSLDKATKLGIEIEPYKENLEKIKGYLKEKPKKAWNDIKALKKEFKAKIKEAEIRREEEEKRRREEEMQRRIEEEAKKRARELEEAERRRIEEEARKKAQEEILTTPELLEEVAERAREERYREFAEMEERAREAAGEIAGPLREALLKAEQDIMEVKSSEKRRLLENYMIIGSILATLEKGLIFDIEHEDEEQMLLWKSGTSLTETHTKLKEKLGMN